MAQLLDVIVLHVEGLLALSLLAFEFSMIDGCSLVDSFGLFNIVLGSLSQGLLISSRETVQGGMPVLVVTGVLGEFFVRTLFEQRFVQSHHRPWLWTS